LTNQKTDYNKDLIYLLCVGFAFNSQYDPMFFDRKRSTTDIFSYLYRLLQDDSKITTRLTVYENDKRQG